jgi:hypothetical protein
MGTPLHEEDIIAIHLYHEWFHFLEERKSGRTDLRLPKVIVSKTGSYKHKKTIAKTREIAAHAFTQRALQLSWSPLLLDYLLTYKKQGKEVIRSQFKKMKESYELLLEEIEKTHN